MSGGLSSFEILLAIAALTLATFVTRAGMLLAGERLRLSNRVEAALRFAPACAITALVLPDVLQPAGILDLSLDNPRWPAALAAALFLLWRHSIAGAIGVGMLVFAIVRVL
jgi:branched-subunit amino acid transport protein